MRACPRCREPLPDDATFCYRCRWRAAEPAPEREPTETATARSAAPTAEDRPRIPAADPEPLLDHVLQPVEPARVPERRRRRPVAPTAAPRWVILTIGALVVALAVAVGALVRTQMEPDIGVGTAVATAPIGPAGGTLPFAPGAHLEVPPQAVDETTVFTVRRFGPGESGEAAVLSVAGAAYAFGPTDLEFAVPVTIVFPLPDGPVPEVVLERGGRSTTVRAFVDRSEETISVRTRNFTDMEIAGS